LVKKQYTCKELIEKVVTEGQQVIENRLAEF